MCGRFVEFTPIERLCGLFPIDRIAAEASPNYNVAPTQLVLAIVHRDGENVLERLHWGLVPFWAENVKIGSRLINARVETARSKPAFREAFKKRRCLILADGFYEWKAGPGKKQPFFISPETQNPLAFAGLWEQWDDRGRAQRPLRSCTILTMPAVAPIDEIHHRMPVVLKPAAYRQWMDPRETGEALERLLAQQIERAFTFRPVSTALNAAGINDPALIAPR